MTNLLTIQQCVPCRGDAPPLTKLETNEFMPEIPEWEVIEVDGVLRLIRKFKFKNFKEALLFANKVGELAEEEGHHPSLVIEWGSVIVSWWTHKINGLHNNDFIMAAKTNEIY